MAEDGNLYRIQPASNTASIGLQKFRSMWKRFKHGPVPQNLLKLAVLTIGKFPANRRLIMFESYLGKQYSCNPRAIYEYLQEHQPTYKMVWSVARGHRKVFIENNIPHVVRFSIRWLFLVARARYWVTNSRLPLWLPKPAHTTYVQTWHGTPLKKLAADMDEVHMPDTTTEKYKLNFYQESRKWDYLISANAYSTKIFRRAFQFDKTIIESGYPRNDYLVRHNNTAKIRELKQRCGIDPDKKVILYAPTWRDDQYYDRGRYKFQLNLDLEQMRRVLGEDYVVILRMHYLVAEKFDLEQFEGFAYDFSKYEDIRDLYLISDVLITDYSSVFFDFAVLRRPVIFFVYDIDTYRDKLRGFYFDLEKNAPGPLVMTTEEIIQEIRRLESNEFHAPKEMDAFFAKFCYLEDGQAARRVVDTIFSQGNSSSANTIAASVGLPAS